jgi:hypothetical protein
MISSTATEKEFFAAISQFDPEYSKTIAKYEQTAILLSHSATYFHPHL